MDKILLTGSNGLLGQKLVKLLRKRNSSFLATSLGENRNPDCPSSNYQTMDICSPAQIKEVFNDFRPDFVLHTAAMTNVDQCELDHTGCDHINVDASYALWEACKSIGAHFQLLSTDFVFDGEKGNYTETDTPNPISYYGNAKWKAENSLLKDVCKNWSIARTIIVYGDGNNLSRSNSVLWAKNALLKGSPLHVVDDQFRAPTWAEDLAWGCLEIVNRKKTGIFHLCGPETFSIYELVERIARFYGFSLSNIQRTSSSALNQAAKRPPKTGFNLSKAMHELEYHPKTLEQTLALLS
jgi:dTDP-4-dehydrorhamnose reductase